ncbi:MAG: hypothetical protein HYU64_02525 [Armatimonadetes bacterium]|nr:hypothetical protein [Armatimonadota bacterium]
MILSQWRSNKLWQLGTLAVLGLLLLFSLVKLKAGALPGEQKIVIRSDSHKESKASRDRKPTEPKIGPKRPLSEYGIIEKRGLLRGSTVIEPGSSQKSAGTGFQVSQQPVSGALPTLPAPPSPDSSTEFPVRKAPSRYLLTGVVDDGDHSYAIIEDQKTKMGGFFKKGDTFGICTVLAIREDQVILDCQGEKAVITLGAGTLEKGAAVEEKH